MIDQLICSFHRYPWLSKCVLLVRCGWRIFCCGMIVYVAYIVVWMFLQLVRCSSFLCRLCLWSRWLCRLHWWCGSCCLGGIGIFFLQLHPTVAHNCHGKTKLTPGKTKFTHRKTKKTSWSAVVICIWNGTSCNNNTLLARKTAIFQLTMFCCACGSVVDEDANFCKSCGRGKFLNFKCSYLHFF